MAGNGRRIAVNKRQDDYDKIDRIAAAISAKSGSNPKSAPPYCIEDSAKDLLLDHMTEVVSAAIEGARTLAKHRGADSISTSDIQLILAKKHGLEVSGARKGNIYIHKNSSAASAAGSIEISLKGKGQKRKFKKDD